MKFTLIMDLWAVIKDDTGKFALDRQQMREHPYVGCTVGLFAAPHVAAQHCGLVVERVEHKKGKTVRIFRNARIVPVVVEIREITEEERADFEEQRERAGREFNLQKLAEDLNLSDDQTTKLRRIEKDFEKQRKALDNKTSLSTEQRVAKLSGFHRSFLRRRDSILTAEQRAKEQE